VTAPGATGHPSGRRRPGPRQHALVTGNAEPDRTCMAIELAHWIVGSGSVPPIGEHGPVAGHGTAHVVARDRLTCLVLSRTPATRCAGRGAGADSAAAGLASTTCAVDVTCYLHRKLAASEYLRPSFQCRPEITSHMRRSRCAPPSATTWPRPA